MWHPDMPKEYRNQIVIGDARDLARRIPDESVDLILCDPPFLREYILLYGWLAEEAVRVLKPGGNVVAEIGTEYLPQIIALMGQSLNWVWLLVERLTGGTAQMFNKRIMVFYSGYVWFSKGPHRNGRWIYDARMGSVDKSWHTWGDGGVFLSDVIDRLTEPDMVVFDPFTGGGTVPAVCKMLGRNYVAFEIDPATAARARERVQNTQPPLFVLQPEQTEMDFQVG